MSEARARIEAIATALAGAAREPLTNLAVGKAGIALCLAHAGRALGRDDLGEAALDCLSDAMAAPHPAPAFAGGAFGVAWVAEQLIALGAETEADGGDDDVNAVADAYLDARLARDDAEDDYDLFNGWVGLGVYALARTHRPGGGERLAAVIARLRRMARPSGRGVTWFRTVEMLPPDSRPMFPAGHGNLGTSHGHAGVLGFLADVVAHTRAVPGALALLDDAASGLVAFHRGGDGRAFAGVLDPDGRELIATPTDWRYGDTGLESWSYGDLGRALPLLAAARLLGRSDLADLALAIARDAAARAAPDTNPWAGLCQGRAGVAYLLARLFDACGDELFRIRSEQWYRATWELFDAQGGVTAYLARRDDRFDGRGPGLLEGLAGLGLAALATLSREPPRWETALAIGATAAS
jgi:hypothetical protein